MFFPYDYHITGKGFYEEDSQKNDIKLKKNKTKKTLTFTKASQGTTEQGYWVVETEIFPKTNVHNKFLNMATKQIKIK